MSYQNVWKDDLRGNQLVGSDRGDVAFRINVYCPYENITYMYYFLLLTHPSDYLDC